MSRVSVGNLEAKVSERDLEDEFRTFGVIRSIWVARKPPGYAFIDFDDRRDAQDAIRELDGRLGSGRRRSRTPPRYRKSPSYGRRSYSPRDRFPSRRSVSPARGRSYSKSPPYKRGREDSPYTNGSAAVKDRQRSRS